MKVRELIKKAEDAVASYAICQGDWKSRLSGRAEAIDRVRFEASQLGILDAEICEVKADEQN